MIAPVRIEPIRANAANGMPVEEFARIVVRNLSRRTLCGVARYNQKDSHRQQLIAIVYAVGQESLSDSRYDVESL